MYMIPLISTGACWKISKGAKMSACLLDTLYFNVKKYKLIHVSYHVIMWLRIILDRGKNVDFSENTTGKITQVPSVTVIWA